MEKYCPSKYSRFPRVKNMLHDLQMIVSYHYFSSYLTLIYEVYDRCLV